MHEFLDELKRGHKAPTYIHILTTLLPRSLVSLAKPPLNKATPEEGRLLGKGARVGRPAMLNS
jgi:hypothetical protein